MATLPLTGKVIAITGAASGIGLETAKLLASRGAHLSLGDQNSSLLFSTSSTLSSTHPDIQIHTFVLDVRSTESVDSWNKEIIAKFGKLDGAANLAGVIGQNIGVHGVKDILEDEWDFIIGVNLTGVMHCMRAQLNVMENGGSIVNAASVAGIVGRPYNAAYTASKHGVVGLTKAAAKEVGEKGIRVNAIAPGRIETPMVAAAKSRNGIEDLGSFVSEVALRRSGKPEEVAKLVGFLLSDDSSYISGHTHSIDGGWFC